MSTGYNQALLPLRLSSVSSPLMTGSRLSRASESDENLVYAIGALDICVIHMKPRCYRRVNLYHSYTMVSIDYFSGPSWYGLQIHMGGHWCQPDLSI